MMDFPAKLEAVLQGDGSLHGSVLIAFSDFQPWLDASGAPFFPEYTDHSMKHVLEVVRTASSLICDDAWAVITPADAALLCLSALLHDSAMHLSEDGFVTLISTRTSTVLRGERPWSDLWADFLSEASRFDGRKLVELFGNSEPIHRPDGDPLRWQLRDRLLIGEFVRRHHSRLAHEIAIAGVPGSGGSRIALAKVPRDLADLAGLIARSHGLDLRDCLKYLDSTDLREYKGVHAIFLMALLRIADYLQMQNERAPKQLLHVRRLHSPISRREWEAHQAVIDIRNTHSDPEAIFVQAAPGDTRTYLKLKRLLNGLQMELDSCWAVLGEVYGRFAPLSSLGLVIRRVRSNLDDEKRFAATVQYIPCDARFDAVGADLLKLLIHPLYGDRPEIGIRELLQNSVDACLELRDYQAQSGRHAAAPDLIEQDSDVLVMLEQRPDGGRFLAVSDRGIGMTAAVVLDYFLKAGASFRRSDAWRQQHQSADGHSRVLRSGRFGVGALAAFLIGDEMSVSTRHVSVPAEEGISFTAGLDSGEIQLNHAHLPVGTTVRVPISSNEVWEALTRWHWAYAEDRFNGLSQWDFYCVAGVTVKRMKVVGSERVVLPQRLSLPASRAKLDPPWHRLSVPGYEDVQWSYEPGGAKLVCNGILISEKRDWWAMRERIGDHGFALLRPTVSVFDPDGHLPLNLQRTDLATQRLPFQDGLWRSICEDFVAWALASAPRAVSVAKDVVHPQYPAFFHEKPRMTLAYTAQGSVVIDPWAFRALSPSKIVFFPITADLRIDPKENELFIPLDLESAGADARKAWFRASVGWNWRDALKPVDAFKATGYRAILRTSFYTELRKPGVIARFIWDRMQAGPSNQRWTIITSGTCDDGLVDFTKLVNLPATAGIDGLTEWFGVTPSTEFKAPIPPQDGYWPLSEVWKEHSKEVVIPYDPVQRRERFRQAYDRLSSLIDYHEKAKKQRKT
jgi:hypothetical protein